MLVLIQKSDDKSKYWSKELEKLGVDMKILKKSSIFWFPFCLKYILINKPNAIYFRYLNDYESFFKTILRTSSEFLTLFLCKLSNVDVFWICHNVDKESTSFYPKITAIRRRMVIKRAKVIFVMDKLLVPFAFKKFPNSKIDYISFGPLKKKTNIDVEIQKKIDEFTSKVKDECFIGLCIGSINYKTIHFEEIPNLILRARESGIRVKIIVGGDIENYIKEHNPHLLDFYNEDNDVLYLKGYYPIQENQIKNLSFVFKCNIDLSIPFSFYTLAACEVPVLTFENTFSSKVVNEYNIGLSIAKDYSNLKEILLRLKPKDFSFKSFLRDHNWSFAAKKFKMYLDE